METPPYHHDVPTCPAHHDLPRLRAALDAAHGLALLGGVLDGPACQAVLALLSALAAPEREARQVATAYGRAFRELAAVAGDEPDPGLRDAWVAHLTARLLDDTNPWSRQAEFAGSTDTDRASGPREHEQTSLPTLPGMASGLREQARRDLRALRLLADLDAQTLWRLARDAVTPEMPALAEAWTPWRDLAPLDAEDGGNDARTALRRRLAESSDWADLADDLAAHWARHGAGPLARYHVLRWEGRALGLRPIPHPDHIRLAQLVGYEREQRLLTANVERFLAGLPAPHALLYGPPGTGKSSTVKAIANAYAERGLRLIEVRKDDLGDLPAIAAAVRGQGVRTPAPRYLLFVDDLSFEEHETQYKPLKALLEGAAEARPANLLLYATTNRRNLIRESFGDRGVPSDDVHGRDSMQEKVSLAARFGLRVTFAAPDQERYLAIATALARQRALALSDDELRARALLWERQHPGRSGRTARQFVDDLEAETHSG